MNRACTTDVLYVPVWDMNINERSCMRPTADYQ